MIPPEKNAAVLRGLAEAFGTTTIEDIRPMPGGLSHDLTLRIVVQGAPYLLKIMIRMDERNDPQRIFPAMQAASAAGLAPRVRYASIDDGVAIIDFVETVPLPVTEALGRIPATLRTLHALPPFPKAFNFITAHNLFIWRFRTANLCPQQEVADIFAHYEKICAVYPRIDSDIVSCHCDLKPENILFDGARLWLVDWQAAFLNDRYFDLAIAANFVVNGSADEQAFLQTYFDQPADDYQLARFFLMRQFTHLFYATVFMLLGKPPANASSGDQLPEFREFHQRIWAGEVNFADGELRTVYGRVHWQQLLRNVREARFDLALKIVSAHDAMQVKLLPSAPQ